MVLRSDYVFLLTMINFLGSIGILISGFIYPNCMFHFIDVDSSPETSSYYSKENKLKLLTDLDNKYQSTNVLNSSIFSEEEKINKLKKLNINITNSYKEKPKLRKLSTDISLFDIAIFANFLTLYCSFVLMISFCIEKDECSECMNNRCYLDYYCSCCGLCACTCCATCGLCCNRTAECTINCCEAVCCCCCSSDCNCDCKCEGGGNEGGGEGLLFLCLILLAVLIVIGFFYLMYYITKICGKQLSRNISLIINSIINLTIFFLVLPEEQELGTYMALSISAFIFLSNIIPIIFGLIIYLKCCGCGNDNNLGTINPQTISDFKLNKKVEEYNRKDITPDDKNNQNEEYYTPIVDNNSDISNKNLKGTNTS